MPNKDTISLLITDPDDENSEIEVEFEYDIAKSDSSVGIFSNYPEDIVALEPHARVNKITDHTFWENIAEQIVDNWND